MAEPEKKDSGIVQRMAFSQTFKIFANSSSR
jgi:hypothetical protein